jgi:hypothetical protein
VETRTPVDIEGRSKQLQIVVSGEATSVQSGPPPPCDDFALACIVTELHTAHAVAFNLLDGDEVVPNIWKGFLNASPLKLPAVLSGLKRKRFEPMQE